MDAFPVSMTVEYRGLARKAGSFTRTENGAAATVEFPDSYGFEYEDGEGIIRQLALSLTQLDQVAGFDVTKATRGERYELLGTVMVRDGWIKPVEMTKATPAARAA
jgi:hypothetical protein